MGVTSNELNHVLRLLDGSLAAWLSWIEGNELVRLDLEECDRLFCGSQVVCLESFDARWDAHPLKLAEIIVQQGLKPRSCRALKRFQLRPDLGRENESELKLL